MGVKWDIIMLGETWSNLESGGVQLDGYNRYKNNMGLNREDGVVVYVGRE